MGIEDKLFAFSPSIVDAAEEPGDNTYVYEAHGDGISARYEHVLGENELSSLSVAWFSRAILPTNRSRNGHPTSSFGYILDQENFDVPNNLPGSRLLLEKSGTYRLELEWTHGDMGETYPPIVGIELEFTPAHGYSTTRTRLAQSDTVIDRTETTLNFDDMGAWNNLVDELRESGKLIPLNQ